MPHVCALRQVGMWGDTIEEEETCFFSVDSFIRTYCVLGMARQNLPLGSSLAGHRWTATALNDMGLIVGQGKDG